MRIAVLDSAPQQRTLIVETLRAAGSSCTPLTQIEPLLTGGPGDEIDLLIHHWHGPIEAQQHLSELSRRWPTLPILLVIGNSLPSTLAELLVPGRDDYLVKPLRRGELLFRVSVLIGRVAPDKRQTPTLQFGSYTFEPQRGLAWRNGNPVTLTQKEGKLALLLFRNLGRPLSRATIHEAVWPKAAELNSRSLDTHISRVRNKLALRPENGYRLAPVYSYGYQLEGLEVPEQNPVTPGV